MAAQARVLTELPMAVPQHSSAPLLRIVQSTRRARTSARLVAVCALSSGLTCAVMACCANLVSGWSQA